MGLRRVTAPRATAPDGTDVRLDDTAPGGVVALTDLTYGTPHQ